MKSSIVYLEDKVKEIHKKLAKEVENRREKKARILED